ncbi:putative lipoprotein [Poriferisphaera corsica]|uniref:Putative lipoprotein n=2 Tax=Poriferisphaera corsica TaxID=2528020 RepID=A0A517YVE5_9BACT|nr:putative lipoprotein [Poriferisphaera corsica]
MPCTYASAEITATQHVYPDNPTTWNENTTVILNGQNHPSKIGTLEINSGSSLHTLASHLGITKDYAGLAVIRDEGSSWLLTQDIVIGKQGIGSLNILDGAKVTNANGVIGSERGSSGTVTVDGNNSVWQNNGDLILGSFGEATLNISNNGTINVNQATRFSHENNINGKINFDNGTLNTTSLRLYKTQLLGTGSINTYGWIYNDHDWVFDALSGATNTQRLNISPEHNISLTLDLSGKTAVADTSVDGSMVVKNGIKVFSRKGYIGYQPDSSGSVTVTGDGSLWDCNDSLHVGYRGQGSLTISNGGRVSNTYSSIGFNVGSQGSVIVDGANSEWNNTDGLVIGNQGDGSLSILNGATVITETKGIIGWNTLANGSVVVSGNNSTWNIGTYLSIAGSGSGTLEIKDGGTVNYTDYGSIAFGSDTNGSITIDGNNSSLNGESLTVANNGIGAINITNGGQLNLTSYLSIGGYGLQSEATAIIDGHNSVINCGGVSVGSQNKTSLLITNGATINANGSATLGFSEGSNSIVTIAGPHSTWNIKHPLTVGAYGNAILNILDGANVNVKDTTAIATRKGSSGVINFTNGGTLTTRQLVAKSEQLSGTGIINTGSWNTHDTSWVFDATNGAISTTTLNDNSYQNVTVNLDLSGKLGWHDLFVGYRDKASVDVKHGVKIYSLNGIIGNSASSQGTVTIQGENSTWHCYDTINLGYQGRATLNILDGGIVNSRSANINTSNEATANVFIAGHNSQWNIERDLRVGIAGIDIVDGASLSNSDAYIGTYSTLQPVNVTVDGPGSEWINNGNLYIGNQQSATVNITNGGTLTSKNTELDATVNISGQNTVWNNADTITMGENNDSTIYIQNGGIVNSAYVEIGRDYGSSSTLAVEGLNSKLNVSNNLFIGDQGTGFLDILDNAHVVVQNTTRVTQRDNNDNQIHFSNGTLTTNQLVATADQLNGFGTINTKAWVGCDADLLFNAASGLKQSIKLNKDSNQNITVNADFSGKNFIGNLTVGHNSQASMTLQDGLVLQSQYVYLGYNQNSFGKASISGDQTSWNINQNLRIGFGGYGSLDIADQGQIIADNVNIGGYAPFSFSQGYGRLTISNHAKMIVNNKLENWFGSKATIVVSDNNMLQIGGKLSNYGLINLIADQQLITGTYTPISLDTSTDHNFGSITAFGGAWDQSELQFTVSDFQYANNNEQLALNLTETQRVKIDESLIVNFQRNLLNPEIQFTASKTSSSALNDLESQLDNNQHIQTSWDFDINGLTDNAGVMLSFSISNTLNADDLTIWHYDGSWSKFNTPDLDILNGWATFYTNDFSSYAITAIPEPSSLLLLLATLGLTHRRKTHA